MAMYTQRYETNSYSLVTLAQVIQLNNWSFSFIFAQEDDEYEDVVSGTPKKGTPSGASSKQQHFGAGDLEFSSIGEGVPAPSSATRSFLKRFSLTGAK